MRARSNTRQLWRAGGRQSARARETASERMRQREWCFFRCHADGRVEVCSINTHTHTHAHAHECTHCTLFKDWRRYMCIATYDRAPYICVLPRTTATRSHSPTYPKSLLHSFCGVTSRSKPWSKAVERVRDGDLFEKKMQNKSHKPAQTNHEILQVRKWMRPSTVW